MILIKKKNFLLSFQHISKDVMTKVDKRKADPTDTLLEIASQRFVQSENTQITDAWCVKLDRMVPEQRLLAEKFVEDILFEGQLGTLNRNSVVINEPATAGAFKSISSTPLLTINNNSDMSDSDISQFFSSFKHE